MRVVWLLLLAPVVLSFSPLFQMQPPLAPGTHSGLDSEQEDNTVSFSRRSFATGAFFGATLMFPQNARAGIDPAALKGYSIEGDQSGSQTRLRQIELERNRPEDLVNQEFIELPSGASYRDYRSGKGDAVVQKGSKVATEMTIRCKSFATANEPGGLRYFATSTDTDFDELAWTIGDEQLPPELEDAMMGMRKGGLRRIELPSTAVYAARKRNQLPLPKTKDGQRRFENLFKTDATLLFEVLVTRIK